MGQEIKRDVAPPSAGEIETLAERVLAALPEPLARHVRGIAIRVADYPDRETRRHFRLSSGYDLLGLYQGVSLLHKSVMDPWPATDMIDLYRYPILAYCRDTGQSLDAVVRHVLIHEIGHHFGFSDEDMERIEREG